MAPAYCALLGFTAWTLLLVMAVFAYRGIRFRPESILWRDSGSFPPRFFATSALSAFSSARAAAASARLAGSKNRARPASRRPGKARR